MAFVVLDERHCVGGAAKIPHL
jgi:transposase